MNRLYRQVRKKHRLATLKEMKISTKRVLRVELNKIQMQETKSILALPFSVYIEQEIVKALESENYERAKELNLLKNR
jgi:hypothetical protein